MRGGAAAACRRLHRGADRRAQRADRQAAPGGDPLSVRLASDRPSGAGQSRRVGARASAQRSTRQDVGLGTGGSAHPSRHHQRHDASWHARPALIALMIVSFARIGAAVQMKVENAFVQNRRLWVRLHEKGGKRNEMPCHHALENYLHAYIDGCRLSDDPTGPLFGRSPAAPGGLAKQCCRSRMRFKWCNGGPSAPPSRRRSGTIRFARPASPPILRMAGRWRRRGRWRIMPQR